MIKQISILACLALIPLSPLWAVEAAQAGPNAHNHRLSAKEIALMRLDGGTSTIGSLGQMTLDLATQLHNAPERAPVFSPEDVFALHLLLRGYQYGVGEENWQSAAGASYGDALAHLNGDGLEKIEESVLWLRRNNVEVRKRYLNPLVAVLEEIDAENLNRLDKPNWPRRVIIGSNLGVGLHSNTEAILEKARAAVANLAK